MPFIEKSGKRVLFLHIPKTGGTSIERALRKVGPLHLCARTVPGFLHVPPEHLTYHDIGALFEETYFDYVFSVVRNPYERLVSEYRMRRLSAEKNLKEFRNSPIGLRVS